MRRGQRNAALLARPAVNKKASESPAVRSKMTANGRTMAAKLMLYDNSQSCSNR